MVCLQCTFFDARDHLLLDFGHDRTPLFRHLGDDDRIGSRKGSKRLTEASHGREVPSAPWVAGVNQHDIEIAFEPEVLESIVEQYDVSAESLRFQSPANPVRVDHYRYPGQPARHLQLSLIVADVSPLILRHRSTLADDRLGSERLEFHCIRTAVYGHIHEAPRITGRWRDRIGRTVMLSAAHDGPELALVRFDLDDLDNATRELI